MSVDVAGRVTDLIFGRWRSQILFAGAQLAVFDHLSATEPRSVEATATTIDADVPLTYRLLRALGSLGLLTEDEARGFRLTDAGALLRTDHPQSLRAMALLEEGPEHYALWKHLPAMIRDGKQNGFVREFGMMGFEYAKVRPTYGDVFNQAMTSYSAVESQLVMEALAGCDLSDVRTWCDVAGGYGNLLCSLLAAYPDLTGIVLDLPEVVDDQDRQIAPRMGLSDRCYAVGGGHVRPGACRGCLLAQAHPPRLERPGVRCDLEEHPSCRDWATARLCRRAHHSRAAGAAFREAL